MSQSLSDIPPPLPNLTADLPPARRSPRPARSSGPSAYAILWCGLAVVALGYLTLMAVKPELLARYVPSGSPGQVSDEAMAEVRSLRDGLMQVQSDVSNLKAALSARDERYAELGSRVAALSDTKMEAPATVPPAANISPTADASQAAPELRLTDPAGELKPAKATTSSATSSTPAQPSSASVINAPHSAETAAAATATPAQTAEAKPATSASAAPLETGSVSKPVSLGQAVVKPADKPVGIKIATGSSLEAIRLSWNLLAERNADSLKNLEPRYRTGVDANGLTFELLAGPVKNAAEARKMCKALTSKAIPCQVAGPFGGEAL